MAVSLLHRLNGNIRRSCVITLRISTQALVFSATEYVVTVWTTTPHVKTVNSDSVVALGPVSGGLKRAPVFQLPVLADITWRAAMEGW